MYVLYQNSILFTVNNILQETKKTIIVSLKGLAHPKTIRKNGKSDYHIYQKRPYGF